MSVQFGKWNFQGKPIDRAYIQKAAALLAPYAPDSIAIHSQGGFATVYGAFDTTRESRFAPQPYVSLSGLVATWDGRLDNRTALALELRLPPQSADVQIVVAAYERWGHASFPRLMGEWAAVLWNPAEKSLILAKDFAGMRPLAFAVDRNAITWSTILDPLVLLAERTFAVEKEYLFRWISSSPSAHLTPYRGISSVSPACLVEVHPGGLRTSRYWDFDPDKRIYHRSDHDYEEHFRAVFSESVLRRLRADAPVLAELSGGMDSSSIVCVADGLLAEGRANCPRLDTVSYYNDGEPDWDERPYFTAVERKRGRNGCHIAVDFGRKLRPLDPQTIFPPTPGFRNSRGPGPSQFLECVHSQGNRVVLTGIGGDEVLGGVTAPILELADLLRELRFRSFARQAIRWALVFKKPFFSLVVGAISAFLPSQAKPQGTALWLRGSALESGSHDTRFRILGPRPSFQANLATLEGSRNQLALATPSAEPLCEFRYPYLDRDLLEFLYAVPRGQIERPGERRSLMRRALRGLLPPEIINRKRKARIARTPVTSLSAEWPELEPWTHNMISAELGLVDESHFAEVLKKARQGLPVPLSGIVRTLQVEFWLRQLSNRHFLDVSQPPKAKSQPRRMLAPKEAAS
jgi:asparagine synthase (glutamine-hydrolysing)